MLITIAIVQPEVTPNMPDPAKPPVSPRAAADEAIRDVEAGLAAIRTKLVLADLAVVELRHAAAEVQSVTDEVLIDLLADWAEADAANLAIWSTYYHLEGHINAAPPAARERWLETSRRSGDLKDRVLAVAQALLGRRRELAAIAPAPEQAAE